MVAILPALVFTLAAAHQGPHWDVADVSAVAGHLVFAAAAHPEEARHFDATSAPEVDRCAACLHRLQSGHARLVSLSQAPAAVPEGCLPASSLRALASNPLSGASPRGPPLFAS